MNKKYCDICEDQNPSYEVFCKKCNEKHNLCAICYELGHVIDSEKNIRPNWLKND